MKTNWKDFWGERMSNLSDYEAKRALKMATAPPRNEVDRLRDAMFMIRSVLVAGDFNDHGLANATAAEAIDMLDKALGR